MKTRAVILAALALAACEERGAQSGAELYTAYCASCHGDDARGGGAPMSGKVPSDLTVLARNNGGVFPSIYVMSTIDGYARDDIHGPMPRFGEILRGPVDLWVDPEGVPTPTPRALILLDAYLAGLQVE